LNLLFTDWNVQGINYWKTSEKTLSLVAGTRNYSLPAGTLDILSAVLRRDGSDIPMDRIALDDYSVIPSKTTQGRPVQYFYDAQYVPQIYLWPVPENSTDTIVYWGVDQIEDVTQSYQYADAPQRWHEALCAGLADKLAIKIPGLTVDRITILAAQAQSSFDKAAMNEGEKTSLRIIPRY